MKLTLGSLFAGIGGLEKGFEDTGGFEVRWQVEIDEWCRRVLTKHWPEVPKYGDIRECGAHNLERVDVLVGGFPCQPHSVAGLRLAQSDDRWLWPEFARIIRAIRPRYVVLENVPGILHSGFGIVLSDLALCGYDAQWRLLRAAEFGAPHRRERLFIVAHPNKVYGKARLGLIVDGQAQVFRTSPTKRDGFWLQAPDRDSYVDDGLSAPIYEPSVSALGNAVIPQVAEYVARCVLEHAQSMEAQP